MKRDLHFIDTQLVELVGEPRLETLAKQHGIKRLKDSESIGKLFAAYLRRADESTLSRIVVELTIVLAASHANAPSILREAATVYKVDTDAKERRKASIATRSKGQENCVDKTYRRGREPAASTFFALLARQGETRPVSPCTRFRLSGPRSPAARQKTFPLLDFPLSCLGRSMPPKLLLASSPQYLIRSLQILE